jgi:hypothetical protein
MTPIGGYASAYDQMQAWSAKRTAALDTFTQQNDQLTAALSGTVDAFSAMMGTSPPSSYFVSNDVMAPAIFSATSNIAGEETLIANIVYTRVMKENQAKMDSQQSQFDSLQQALSSLDVDA